MVCLAAKPTSTTESPNMHITAIDMTKTIIAMLEFSILLDRRSALVFQKLPKHKPKKIRVQSSLLLVIDVAMVRLVTTLLIV